MTRLPTTQRTLKARGLSISTLALLAATCLGFITAQHAAADPVYDSGGFELPRFVAMADLNGQDATQGPWQKDAGTSTATVHTNQPHDGLHSVRVERDGSATGDTRWGVTTSTTPTSTMNTLTVDFDMWVTLAADANPETADFGPLFGVEMYDDSAGGPKLIGGVLLDAGSGDVLYRQAGTGSTQATGTFLARNQYHHYTLLANFTDKTYAIFIDGSLVHTEAFVDGSASSFTDAPITTLAGDAASDTGIAYFDNYAVSLVPEPATGALAAAAVAAALLTRRRRA